MAAKTTNATLLERLYIQIQIVYFMIFSYLTYFILQRSVGKMNRCFIFWTSEVWGWECLLLNAVSLSVSTMLLEASVHYLLLPEKKIFRAFPLKKIICIFWIFFLPFILFGCSEYITKTLVKKYGLQNLKNLIYIVVDLLLFYLTHFLMRLDVGYGSLYILFQSNNGWTRWSCHVKRLI